MVTRDARKGMGFTSTVFEGHIIICSYNYRMLQPMNLNKFFVLIYSHNTVFIENYLDTEVRKVNISKNFF